MKKSDDILESNGIVMEFGDGIDVFKDKDTITKENAKEIEDMISCNLQNLEKGGTLSIVKDNCFKLQIKNGTCSLSDENAIFVVISYVDNIIISKGYYGCDAKVSFNPKSKEFNHGIETIKSFLEAWEVDKGFLVSPIILLDSESLYDLAIQDSSFENCFILLVK